MRKTACLHCVKLLSTIALLPKFQISIVIPVVIFFGCCTVLFVSDLVRNPKDRICHDEAPLVPL